MTCQTCDKPAKSRGLCNTHYVAYWRANQPDQTVQKTIAKIRKRERELIIRRLEKLPIHLVRWEVINYIEGVK